MWILPRMCCKLPLAVDPPSLCFQLLQKQSKYQCRNSLVQLLMVQLIETERIGPNISQWPDEFKMISQWLTACPLLKETALSNVGRLQTTKRSTNGIEELQLRPASPHT